MIEFYYLEEYEHPDDGWGMWARFHQETNPYVAREWWRTYWPTIAHKSCLMTLDLPDGTSWELGPEGENVDEILTAWIEQREPVIKESQP